MTASITTLNGSQQSQAVELQPALDGFTHIKRYWDKTNQKNVAKILPGEYYVTIHHELITTVLGSCISVCVRDVVHGIGGMNHFMLPIGKRGAGNNWGGIANSASARYGNFAMEHLINGILTNGGKRKNLEVKIFGGGRIISEMTDVGANNIIFIKEYIDAEALNLTSEDVGDIYPRKILYDPITGRVKMKKLRTLHNDTIITRETSYSNQLEETPIKTGDIDLF